MEGEGGEGGAGQRGKRGKGGVGWGIGADHQGGGHRHAMEGA